MGKRGVSGGFPGGPACHCDDPGPVTVTTFSRRRGTRLISLIVIWRFSLDVHPASGGTRSFFLFARFHSSVPGGTLSPGKDIILGAGSPGALQSVGT